MNSYSHWGIMTKEKNKKKELEESLKHQTKRNIMKTSFGMLFIILAMAVIFNFSVPLAWVHEGTKKVNIILWSFSQFAELVTYKWIGMNGHWEDSIDFFLSDLPYVLLLIFIFGYAFNFARSFSTDDEITQWLSTKQGFSGRLVGSIMGFVSPFCSCSTIPVMTTLAKARAPFGTVVSFLITSPMINETGIAIMWAMFGYRISLIYIVFGFLIGIIGSYIATWLKLDDQFRPSLFEGEDVKFVIGNRKITFKYLHKRASYESRKIFKSVWWIMIIAIAIGAAMHGWIPEDWIRNNVGNKWWGPLALVPLGTLLYLNITATLPITQGLIDKGLGAGAAMSFTMGVNTLSLPEIIMLNKIFKMKFMIFFVTYLVSAILLFAYVLWPIPQDWLIIANG